MYMSNGGRALNGLGAYAGYQNLSNSECRIDKVQESDSDREVPLSKGKQPRPPAKVPKLRLSGKGCGFAKTARMLA